MNKFQSKTSYVIITFFLGAIMLSFALTGFEGFNSSQGSVGSVNGEAISFADYQRSYNQELNRFSQMFGGKNLTPQQIRQFRIKEGVINRLVQQRLILDLAKKMKLDAGTKEIKDEIKKAPYFLTNKKFDVNKYKALLSQNNYSPSKYEELVSNDISNRKIINLISSIKPSKAHTKEILKFKKNIITTSAVELKKESLTKFIKVTNSEVKKFSSDKKNEKILENLFNASKSSFNTPAKVTARHILYKIAPGQKESSVLNRAKKTRKKLTRKNFARIAGQETQDESGKGSKGGNLGEFTKGRMVPEFEKAAFSMKPGQISKPIKTSFGYHIILVEKSTKAVTKKLSDVKSIITRKHLQKSNRKALNKLVESLKVKLTKSFKEKNYNQIKKLSKKYDFKFLPSAKVNQFDLSLAGISLPSTKVKSLFNKKNELVIDDTPIKISIAQVKSRTSNQRILADVKKSLESEVLSTAGSFTNNLQGEITKFLRSKAKVVTYPSLL